MAGEVRRTERGHREVRVLISVAATQVRRGVRKGGTKRQGEQKGGRTEQSGRVWSWGRTWLNSIHQGVGKVTVALVLFSFPPFFPPFVFRVCGGMGEVIVPHIWWLDAHVYACRPRKLFVLGFSWFFCRRLFRKMEMVWIFFTNKVVRCTYFV